MFSPFLSGKQNRSDEEVAEWERQQTKFGKDYESPWLSGLVTFSGFVAAFIGSVAVLFVIANLRNGTVWLPYALILAALVGAHLSLRAVRYRRRRHAGQPGRSRRAPGHRPHVTRLRLAHMAGRGILAPYLPQLPIAQLAATVPRTARRAVTA